MSTEELAHPINESLGGQHEVARSARHTALVTKDQYNAGSAEATADQGYIYQARAKADELLADALGPLWQSDAPVFYSALERALEELPQQCGFAQQRLGQSYGLQGMPA